MVTPKRRGTRIVTGYVISLYGASGGPWKPRPELCQRKTYSARERLVLAAYMHRDVRKSYLAKAREEFPNARVLPVVRYELDREEERLRDAVVEAALAYEANRFEWLPLESATRALRAHLEKKR